MSGPRPRLLLTYEHWLRAQRDAGLGLDEIGELVGVSKSVVWYWARSHGLSFRKQPKLRYPLLADRDWLRRRREAGRSLQEIANEIGCTTSAVTERLSQHGLARNWTTTRVAILNGRPVLLKRCEECGRDGTCEEGGDFWVHARRADGSVKTWSPVCRRCMAKRERDYLKANAKQINARRRESYRKRMETDPEFRERRRVSSRETTKRWQERNPAAYEEAQRKSRVKRRAKRNEDARLDYALRQERNGRTVRRRAGETVIDQTLPRVPSEPFRRWFTVYLRARGEPLEHLCEELGVNHRRVRAVLYENQREFAFDAVDRALTRAKLTVAVDGRAVVAVDDLYDESTIRKATKRVRA